MKNLLLLAFLCSSIFGFSQTLKTANLDLNPGGVIYDVIFDEYSNAFIVVGDFTSIQGVARNNMALIDATTFTVQSENPIFAINGAIRTVALKRAFLFPAPNKNYLYIGGDFTEVNGLTRNYICQLQRPEPNLAPFISNYNVNAAWDADLIDVFDPSFAVNDLTFFGDSIIAAGKFSIYTGFTSWATQDFGGLFCFKADANTMDAFEMFTSFPDNAECYQVAFFDEKLYVAHDVGFDCLDTSDVLDVSFASCNGDSYVFNIHATDQDTLMISRLKFAADDGIALHSMEGALLNCAIASPLPYVFQNGFWGVANGFSAVYGDQVFTAEHEGIWTYERDGLTVLPQPDQEVPVNNSWYTDILSGWRSQKIKVVNDKLFIFGDNLTTVDGQAHQGLAAFCLPPKDAENFIESDTVVCQQVLEVYTIPTAEFATGYKWSYSGTGAQYRVAGSGAPLQALTTNYINNVNANSIEVYYPAGATSGELLVEPYSLCNSPIDYMLAAGQSLNIQVVPLPDVSMNDTTFFNCYSDSSWMVVNSTTAGISSYIYKGTDTTFNDSMLFEINTLPAAFPFETYYGVVVEPINQCIAVDSSVFVIDTIPANLSGTFGASPSFMTCNSGAVQINCTVPNATIYWENANDPTIPLPNPFTIYSTDSLDFDVFVTDLSNGCLSMDSLSVPTDTSTSLGSIVGYTNPGFPLDSLSCNDPTISLTCQAVDGTAEWLSNGMPTASNVLNLTQADTVGQVNNVKIYQYQTTKTGTGCQQVFEIAIYFDFDVPFVAPHQGTPSINCSQAVAQVVHLNSGNPIEGWLDAFGGQTQNDTLFATSAADYYYQVQGTNGCINTDTVNVAQTLEMTVSMPEDTLICPEETITITAVPILNTGETPTFSWSSGATTSSTLVTGGVDTELTVVVETPSGCIGYDTTEVLITDPILAYFSASAGCVSAAIQVDSLSGGNGNYEYSLDQTVWQTTPAFTDVNVGELDIFIRDDLGCVYGFQQTINPVSEGLDVNFLVPTYNDLGDTAVAVNYGSFLGFDSLSWVLPPAAVIAYQADSLVAFTMETEGWYDITLIGYSDTCQYSTTHKMYFGFSAHFDAITSDLGIQSMVVYPNPTNGNFTLEVALGTLQNYVIQVLSSTGQPLQNMSVSGVGQSIFESFQFPLGAVPGSYIIHFICDYDIAQETIILN